MPGGHACSAPNCTSAYWDYSSWTPCNAHCDSGVSNRTANCVAPAGGNCTRKPANLTMACNLGACEVHSWSIGAWGDCNAACGGGQQVRQVGCVDSSGSPATDDSCTGLPKPATTQRCNLQACTFCAGNTCSGRGSCSAGMCTCSAQFNYTGTYCEVRLVVEGLLHERLVVVHPAAGRCV